MCHNSNNMNKACTVEVEGKDEPLEHNIQLIVKGDLKGSDLNANETNNIEANNNNARGMDGDDLDILKS